MEEGRESGARTDRRRRILDAAVEVFAERGFHRTRVSDIAKRAGVAYGLIYHYFDSKEAVLDAVFEVNWAVFLEGLRTLAAEPGPAMGKLRSIADMVLDLLDVAPDIVQVVIQEVSRSDRFVEAKKLQAFREGFERLGAIVAEGQARGELRSDIDPLAAAHAVLGALETVATAVLLGSLGHRDERAALRRTMHAVLDGLGAGRAEGSGT